MMTLILCHANHASRGGLELLEQWENKSDSWLWLDIENETNEQEISLLRDRLGFDELLIKEAQRKRHPPSVEFFPDYFYLLNKRLTRRYGQILLNLEHRLDEIEDELFTSRDNQLLQELVGYSTALRKMHRILDYHVEAFAHLAEQQRNKNQGAVYGRFDDILALIQRYLSLSELYQSVIDDLANAYISLDSHHLNQIMKVLTIVTVVFLPLSLLVGIYGMNFEYIPELKAHYGYFILLSVMLVLVSGLLFWFKKVRWL